LHLLERRQRYGDARLPGHAGRSTEAGIWICALSEYSSVDDVILSGNYEYGGINASGIGATGDVSNIIMENNTIKAIQGGLHPARSMEPPS
jgi:hypothetical protein